MREDISLKLIVVISKAYKHLFKCLEDDIKQYGINITEFSVLELLYNKGPHPIQQIGDNVLLASASLTYVIDKLVHKGYVSRSPCESDKRVIYVSLTESGTSFISTIFPKHSQTIKELTYCLANEQLECLVDHLKTLGINAQNHNLKTKEK